MLGGFYSIYTKNKIWWLGNLMPSGQPIGADVVERPVVGQGIEHNQEGKADVGEQRLPQRNVQKPGNQRRGEKQQPAFKRAGLQHPHAPAAPLAPAGEDFVETPVEQEIPHHRRYRHRHAHAKRRAGMGKPEQQNGRGGNQHRAGFKQQGMDKTLEKAHDSARVGEGQYYNAEAT